MRKHTKRKIRPLINPVSFVLEGVVVTPKADLDKLRLRELAALESFAKGMAKLQDWSDINAMSNLAETMARLGVGRDEVLPVCAKVQDELMNAAKRFEATRKMGCTGPGLQAFRELFEYHDLQRTSVPRCEYERFIEITANRIRSQAPEVKNIE